MSTSAASESAPKRTLTELTYEKLREDIISGALVPDQKLRVEHLKSRYDVGSGTLREAITRLVSDALVIAEGQRGFRVAPIAAADFRDLTQLRIHIEINALRLSMQHGNAAWREQLEQAYAAVAELEQPLLPERAAAWEQRNTRFHQALLAGYDSPWTVRILRMLARQSERYRRYGIHLAGNVHRDVHAEHRDIYKNALSGNELRAALALEAHIRATADLVSRALDCMDRASDNGDATDEVLSYEQRHSVPPPTPIRQ